jgi:flagellar motility protein MotE (MotC chaperone)
MTSDRNIPENSAEAGPSSRIRLIPLTLGLAVAVLGMKIFHIPQHIQVLKNQQDNTTGTPAPLVLPSGAASASQTPDKATVVPVTRRAGILAASPTPDLKELPAASSAEELQILAALKQEKEKLSEREKDLQSREAALKVLEERTLEQVRLIEADKSRRAERSRKNREIRQKSLDTLVKTYETMKPKIAADLLQSMDLELVMQIIPRMKQARLTSVMSAMDPAAARLLSARLAEQGVTLPGDAADPAGGGGAKAKTRRNRPSSPATP